MDEKKLLDLTVLTEEQFARVKHGWDLHNMSSKLSYFGQIGKNDLKDINRAFNYLDVRSFKKGVVVTLAGVMVVNAIKKRNEKKKQTEEVTVEENTEE